MPTTLKELIAAANEVVPIVSPQEAGGLIESGALVVDVRDPPEVAVSGKVKGALNVSRGTLELRADPESPAHDPSFDKGRTVIVYCGFGGRAALAGKTLKDLGYRDVRNLGGFKDWVAAGGEIDKPEG